jgi:anti-sigma factor (TIGR02949 family)
MTEHCREALEELERYLDHECGPDLEAAIRTHLGDCPPCLDRAEFERELRRIVASRCRDAAPSGLLDRIIGDMKTTTSTGDA